MDLHFTGHAKVIWALGRTSAGARDHGCSKRHLGSSARVEPKRGVWALRSWGTWVRPKVTP